MARSAWNSSPPSLYPRKTPIFCVLGKRFMAGAIRNVAPRDRILEDRARRRFRHSSPTLALILCRTPNQRYPRQYQPVRQIYVRVGDTEETLGWEIHPQHHLEGRRKFA